MLPGKPIALGRTAEIYAWGEDQVLKLFYEWVPEINVEYEAQIARTVHATGLPVPAVEAIVRVDGRLGLEYERVRGTSMGKELEARPWHLWRLARLLAELHAEMHAIAGIDGLPSQRERLAHKIREAQALGPELQEAGLKALASMPGGESLCHGDFHPWNVILSAEGPVVIDWVDATVGNPLADVARTTVLLEGERAAGGATSWTARTVLRLWHRAYIGRYLALRPRGNQEYQSWQPIVAAGRMSEGIDRLRDWLRGQAEAGFGQSRE
jgi:uncharacterized protein (TIGR02172 family)